MVELVERCYGMVVDAAEAEETSTCDTETHEEYMERMESVLYASVDELVNDYDRVDEAIAEWFSEDALMRNHADLVWEVLREDITNMFEDTDERDRLVLKACLLDDYLTEYPRYVKYD